MWAALLCIESSASNVDQWQILTFGLHIAIWVKQKPFSLDEYDPVEYKVRM